MNATEMLQFINKTAKYRIKDMTILVKIVNVRLVFGRVDCQIEPVSGSGETWVGIDNLYIKEGGE